MGGFTVAPSISVVILKFDVGAKQGGSQFASGGFGNIHLCTARSNEEPGLMLVGTIFWLAALDG